MNRYQDLKLVNTITCLISLPLKFHNTVLKYFADADYNYDLKFSGKGASRLIFPAVANVTDFTLILYVRFSEINGQGTIFSMCAAE